MNDLKICSLELKNKLDDGGFDGTDLYNNFKLINKRKKANFFKGTLKIVLCYSILPCYLFSLRTAFRKVGV